MSKAKTLLSVLFFLLVLCSASAQTTEVVFIQMNDVYEIAPLEGGRFGGLARVASVVKQYKAKNPHTYVVLSGDFISPSALGTSEYEGKRINGRQMVDVMNAIGIDFVTFGNHEFDYKPEVLQERINQSDFEWISSNVFYLPDTTQRDPIFNRPVYPVSFAKQDSARVITFFPEYKVLEIPGYLKNQPIKLGLLGLCIDANKQPYVSYTNWVDAGKRIYSQIKDSINYLIGITHLAIEQDKDLASKLPELSLIMGGHEHVNMYHKVGNTIITKADANARTIYIHTLKFDEQNNLIDISSDLMSIDSAVAEDPDVKLLVDEWTARAFKGFIDKGFDPLRMVYDMEKDTLDGREETVRYGLCAMGYLIANAMFDVSPGADLAFFNSGAIRIDDVLTGEITQYDIIRVLPFGGKILNIEIKGSLLSQVLKTGWSNKENGGFLQFYGAEYTGQGFRVNGAMIQDSIIYKAAVADYLLTGMEQNFGYLTKDNPGIVKITYPDPNDKTDFRNDIRFAVIQFFKKWEQPKTR